MLSSTTVLNIDDNMKYFFNSKSAYYNDHVTLKKTNDWWNFNFASQE